MDATQIAELREWARRLDGRAEDSELRAAARAILLLVDEIERLQRAPDRAGSPRIESVAAAAESRPVESPVALDEEPVDGDTTLRTRLRRAFGYSGDA